MSNLKRIASIQDISGFGKCSLTVAIPIISAMGIEVSVVPTAILSTHTGITKGYTYRDFTEDIIPFVDHWKSIDIKFDALYSGYLASSKQIDIISNVFDKLKQDNTLILVDPVMGDNGKLYNSFSNNIIIQMRELCKKADIIVPNITEAFFLLGYKYKEGYYKTEYLENLLIQLSNLGPEKVVVTGISFNKNEVGIAVYDKTLNSCNYLLRKNVEGYYPGTGDIFCSALLGGIVNNLSLNSAAKIALDFTTDSIIRTFEQKTNPSYGVSFEKGIPQLINNLKNIKIV